MRWTRYIALAGVTLSLVGAAEAGAGSCVSGPETLCLLENRFSVEVQWEDFDAETGNGQVLPLVIGDTTGFFSYDDGRYLELMVRVLDVCGALDRYWVFATGLFDYLESVTVTDTATGFVKTYAAPLGGYLNLIDTDAFPTCPPLRTPSREEAGQHKGTTTLELVDGRFSAEVSWRDFNEDTGVGMPVSVTDPSGYFWFFGPGSPTLLLKLFDGSAENGHFWVNFAGPTNLEFTLEVTDNLCQTTASYFNPPGNMADAVSDRTSFLANCVIFSDGFESGDLSAWSASEP